VLDCVAVKKKKKEEEFSTFWYTVNRSRGFLLYLIVENILTDGLNHITGISRECVCVD
jgi:hypothetical protein